LNEWLPVGITILALLLASNIWLIYRVLNPLHRLAAQTTDVAQGNLLAFTHPCGGIAEIGILRRTMASMAGHVRRTQEDERAYRYALTDGQEAERARIAHELHDDTVQSLVAIAQSIDLASSWIQKDPERAVGMLKMARTQAVEAVEELRRLIADLRPPALEELGLVPALHMLAESESTPSTDVEVTGNERRLDQARELTLFRAAQEAIRNAQRHGHAKKIGLRLDYEAEEARLTVSDDGLGFQVPDCVDCLAKEGHFGLVGIHERVQHLGGKVKILSQPKQGTELIVTLPLSAVGQPTERVRDPVCGALIAPQQAYGSVEHQGQRYYFCCPVCQGAFQSNPEMYLIP
jgi:signal transduction histidine kinase/YHS domain-containing protein